MNVCENKVLRYVGLYAERSIQIRCGSTNPSGGIDLCDVCLEKYEKRYPQGWRDVPGDLCCHGNYVGTAGGADYMCGRCEDGER